MKIILSVLVVVFLFSVQSFGQTGEMLRLIKQQSLKKGVLTLSGISVSPETVNAQSEQVTVATAPIAITFRMSQYSAPGTYIQERMLEVEKKVGPIAVAAGEQQFASSLGAEVKERFVRALTRLPTAADKEVSVGGLMSVTTNNIKAKERAKVLAVIMSASRNWKKYSLDTSLLVGKAVYENKFGFRHVSSTYTASVEASRKFGRISLGAFLRLFKRGGEKFIAQHPGIQSGLFLRYDSRQV